MNINGFKIRFTINHQESDVGAALAETYLPAYAHVEDAEVQLLCALETMAEDLIEGGNEVDFSMRTA